VSYRRRADLAARRFVISKTINAVRLQYRRRHRKWRQIIEVSLSQEDAHKEFLALGSQAWTVARRSWWSDDAHGGIYCAFAPVSYRSRALADPGWDLTITDGRPGFSQSYGEQGTVTTYHRNAHEPLEPLVLIREFYGAFPSTMEIAEEFRLYHNLRWDQDTSQFIQPHDDGTSSVAIKMSKSEIIVRTKLLRQYQADERRYQRGGDSKEVAKPYRR